MEDIALSVKDLKKYFNVPDSKEHGALHFIRSLVGSGDFTVNKVIDGISFDIKKGECFGIIGPNGTGKSTLMKLLAGVLYPDEGTIEVSGSVFPLLNLGVGFQNDLTAKDNVYQYGSILGLTDAQLKKKLHHIFKYAELEGFENLQLKYFSSGMRVRLAFSIAMEVNPEILLLDEVLSVGDVAFKSKSKQKILSICNSGSTVVIISHSTGTINEICDRAMFLKDGKIGMIGETEDVVDAYLEEMAEFLGTGEIVTSQRQRKKILKKEKDQMEARFVVDIVKLFGLMELVSGIYDDKAGEYLDHYISQKNLTKINHFDPNNEEEAFGFGSRWLLMIHELGDEERSRTFARQLLTRLWDDGLLAYGEEKFSAFFSDSPLNKGLLVPKNISIAMLFEDSHTIPLVFDYHEGMVLNNRLIHKIVKNAGIDSANNSLLAVPSELVHRTSFEEFVDSNIPFLLQIESTEIEDNPSFLEFFTDIISPGNLLLYEDTPLFAKKGIFNCDGPEIEGIGYYSSALFTRDSNRFFSEIKTLKDAFTAHRKETELEPRVYIRQVAKKNERYFTGTKSGGLIEVQIDKEAVEKRQRCFGMTLLLMHGQHDPILCYRYNGIRWTTEQWFRQYRQIFSITDPLQRGKALLKLIDLTIQIAIKREELTAFTH